jgi:hypothetical protein
MTAMLFLFPDIPAGGFHPRNLRHTNRNNDTPLPLKGRAMQPKPTRQFHLGQSIPAGGSTASATPPCPAMRPPLRGGKGPSR